MWSVATAYSRSGEFGALPTQPPDRHFAVARYSGDNGENLRAGIPPLRLIEPEFPDPTLLLKRHHDSGRRLCTLLRA
jgi:hypothetical protein